MRKIVLASNSPRRREILKGLGVNFQVVASNVEEKVIKNFTSTGMAKHFALIKAKDVFSRLNGKYLVIGADTVVEYNRILGKPRNEQEAYDMLRLLSGNVHRVITGFAILDCLTGQQFVDYESTKVYFRYLKDREIQDYIATGEYIDKAGAYAIQGKASLFIQKIEGDYFNVVGLPVFKLGEALHNNFDINLL